MTKQEQIFYDWLFSSDEERKKWNPFSTMLKNSAKELPKVPTPKFN